MTQTSTRSASASATFSVVDIEKVHRRARADLIMISESSGAITVEEARAYADDFELLAKHGYLRTVDMTLFSDGKEVCAVQYEANTAAGDLTSSRPGGAMWPRVYKPWLRIFLRYTRDYDAAARAKLSPHLKINWQPSNADISHGGLRSSGGRDYASRAYGLQRRDWN